MIGICERWDVDLPIVDVREFPINARSKKGALNLVMEMAKRQALSIGEDVSIVKNEECVLALGKSCALRFTIK